MDFKVLVLMALLNLAISMPGPDPGVVVNVNVNVQDNDDSNNRPDNVGKDNVKCGVVNPASTRVINGVDVNVPRKYSWQVRLITLNIDPSFQYASYARDPLQPYRLVGSGCGGSIITDRHILTAAHCVCGTVMKLANVSIGEHDTNVKTENLPEFVEPIQANGITIHENYVCGEDPNDIAIIELSRPIDLVKHAGVIHPICLPKDDSETYTGRNATITGWGSTLGYTPLPANAPDPDADSPNILQEAYTPVLSNSRCRDIEGFGIQETMICALGVKVFNNGFVQGTCQGDSGGPLFIKEKEKEQHVQIGITSFGAGCGSGVRADVYTRVSKYLKWIKEHVGSEMIYTLH